MKQEDKNKLNQKKVKELQADLVEVQKELVEARIKMNKGQLENVRYPAELRNKIAVIKTLISQKEASAEQKGKDE